MRVESSGGRDGREHFAVPWAQQRRAGFMSELIA